MASEPSGLESDDIQFASKIRDRLHYTWLLQEQVRTFQKSVLNIKFSRRELEDSIKGLVSMIPDLWKVNDQKWLEEYAKASTSLTIDIRPSFGAVKMSKAFCKKMKIPMTKTIKLVDYFVVLQAVFNKLFRMGMLSKREWQEGTTGMPPGETALPKGMNLREMDSYIVESRERIERMFEDLDQEPEEAPEEEGQEAEGEEA